MKLPHYDGEVSGDVIVLVEFSIARMARRRLPSCRKVFVWQNVKGRKIVTKDANRRDI